MKSVERYPIFPAAYGIAAVQAITSGGELETFLNGQEEMGRVRRLIAAERASLLQRLAERDLSQQQVAAAEEIDRLKKQLRAREKALRDERRYCRALREAAVSFTERVASETRKLTLEIRQQAAKDSASRIGLERALQWAVDEGHISQNARILVERRRDIDRAEAYSRPEI